MSLKYEPPSHARVFEAVAKSQFAVQGTGVSKVNDAQTSVSKTIHHVLLSGIKYGPPVVQGLRLSVRPNQERPHRNVQRFRGGLVCKAHELVYHSTLGLRVIKKKKTAGVDPLVKRGMSSHTVEYKPFIKSQLASRN